jgi:SWI/SNF-related matrix-associated actin-dependent regulator of chromatin subfamily A member 5
MALEAAAASDATERPAESGAAAAEAPAEDTGNALIPNPGDAAAPADANGVEGTWLERVRARNAALKTIQAREKAELGAKTQANAKERLAYLMRQTDIFAHFMGKSVGDDADGAARAGKAGGGKAEAGGGKAGSSGADAGAGRRTKGRMTEKQEDELLLKAAETDAGEKPTTSAGTRLLAQPKCINGTLRAYQLEGLNWLIKLHEHGINGILADEMGLGKTLQTISLLGYLKEVQGIPGPHLVIVPKSVLTNWHKELDKWCPSLRAFKFHGDKAARAAMRAEYFDSAHAFDVCITTFETAISEKAALERVVWRYLIIDEAHRIKNEQGKLSQVVRIFSAHFRLLITGTPLQNNLHELWSMLNFLLPDIFSSSDQFDEWFNPNDAGGQTEDVLHQLHRLLRPFLLRRLKSEVEKDLPPKREIKLMIGMSELQRTWYQNILTKNIEVLKRRGGGRVKGEWESMGGGGRALAQSRDQAHDWHVGAAAHVVPEHPYEEY